MCYIKDSEGKNRKAKEVECDFCKVKFLKPIRFIIENSKNYCCIKHKHLAQRNGNIFKCGHCNKEVYRSPSKQKNSKSGLFFCNRVCKEKAQSYIKEIQPDHYNNGINNYRKIAFNVYPKICNRCAYNDFEALIVHHKDRNRTNNEPSNLEVLCANCHMKEHRGCYTG